MTDLELHGLVRQLFLERLAHLKRVDEIERELERLMIWKPPMNGRYHTREEFDANPGLEEFVKAERREL